MHGVPERLAIAIPNTTECAIPGSTTNWRSPLGSCEKKSVKSLMVAMPSYSPRISSTGASHLLGVHHAAVSRSCRDTCQWDLIAELQFLVGQELGDGRIGGAGFVARKDAADHGAIAQAAVVGAVVIQVLRAFG